MMDIFVELVRRRNTADVESQPRHALDAGDGKGVVLFGRIDAETRMRMPTDKVVYNGFV